MRLAPIAAMVTALVFASASFAADIGGLAWDQSNIAKLRSLSKADLLAFFNEERRKAGVVPEPLTASEIAGFEWADLANNGQYRLVLVLSEPCAHAVDIETRAASGKVTTVQIIQGFANLKTGIRDLNGDGKDELIIGKTLVEYSCAAIATWTAVYRLENGKYVEASRDFPNYYDTQVLPELEKRIASLGEEVAANPSFGFQRGLAIATMEKDKILRVLGRKPDAGLNHAYQWMNSDDPQVLQCAIATFRDIGGHQQDADAAVANLKRALCERHPTLAMCRNLPGSGKPATP